MNCFTLRTFGHDSGPVQRYHVNFKSISLAVHKLFPPYTEKHKGYSVKKHFFGLADNKTSRLDTILSFISITILIFLRNEC